MSRLKQLRVVDPVLTNLSTGYQNEELVGEYLFPVVTVDKEAGEIPKFGKEAFKVYATERGLRADSNRIDPNGRDKHVFSTTEHDIEQPIDYREENESMFDEQAIAVSTTTQIIQLSRERKCASIAQNAANYPTGHKVTLVGGDQFSDYANSDPIGVVDDAKEAVSDKIVFEPNTMVIAKNVYKFLKHHPQLLERVKYSQKGLVTLDLMREIFEVEHIVVGKAVGSNDAGLFSQMWENSIVMAYVDQGKAGRNVRIPSYAYTLRLNGMPQVDTYNENGGKIQIVRCTDNFDAVLLGAEAGYLISGVVNG